MLSLIPHISNVVLAGFSVPLILVTLWISIIAGILILVIETRRLKLNVAVVVLIYMLNYALGNLIGRIIFVISRIWAHNDLIFQNGVFYFYTDQKVAFGKVLGIIFAVPLVVYFYRKWKKLGNYYDVFFLTLTAAVFVRVGNALTRYHPGKITDPSWGVLYLGQYRHLPSLYEAASLGVLFIVAWTIRKRIKRPGFLSLIILAWTSFSRFITDFFRNDDLPLMNFQYTNAFISSNYHLGNGLTLNQVAYLILFLLAIAGMVYIWKREGNIFSEPKRDKPTLI